MLKIRFILVLLFAFSQINTNAQCFTPKVFSGSSDDIATHVTTDASGNVITIMQISSPSVAIGSTIATNTQFHSSSRLVKYAPNGTVLWITGPNTIGNSFGSGLTYNSITTDQSNNIYVLGGLSHSVTIGNYTLNFNNSDPNNCDLDLVIVKYNSSGTPLWVKQIPNCWSGTVDPEIAINSFGDIYVKSDFRCPTITIGSNTFTNTQTNGGSRDIIIAKFDNTGSLLWAKSGGGTYDDVEGHIAVNSIGDLYFSGRANSLLTYTYTFDGIAIAPSLFVIRFNSNGSLIWKKEATVATPFNGNSYMPSHAIVVDSNNDIYIGGGNPGGLPMSYSGITTTIISNSFFILKIDPSGNLVWGKDYGKYSNYTNLAIGLNNDIYAYHNYYYSLNPPFNAGDGLFLDKFNSNGDKLVSIVIGNSKTEALSCIDIATDNTGRAFLLGSFSSYNTGALLLGGSTYSCAGNSDGFLVSDFHVSNASSVSTCKTKSTGSVYLNLTGATSPYNVLWSSSQTSTVAAGLPEGNYSVTVQDALGCMITSATAITPWSAIPITLNYTKKDVSCIGGGNNGSVTLTPTGGSPALGSFYTLVWNTTNTLSFNMNSITNLPVGSYVATATDEKGCVASNTIQVNQDYNPSAFSYTTNGMVATFSLSGTGCNTFNWDFGNGNTSNINPNPVVTYASSGTYGICVLCNGMPPSCGGCINITLPGNTVGGVGIEEQKADPVLNLYPNPSRGQFTILLQSGKTKLMVYNTLGQLIFEKELLETKNQIDLNVPKGIYYFNAYSNDRLTQTGKLVVN